MTLVEIAFVCLFPFCISLVNYVCNKSFFAIKSLLVAKLHIIIVHMGTQFS